MTEKSHAYVSTNRVYIQSWIEIMIAAQGGVEATRTASRNLQLATILQMPMMSRPGKKLSLVLVLHVELDKNIVIVFSRIRVIASTKDLHPVEGWC